MFLLKKIRKIENFSAYGFNYVHQIISSLKNGQLKIVSFDDRRNCVIKKYSNEDFQRIETWSTFQNCVVSDIKYENKKYTMESIVYDGDNLYGHKTNLRFIITFEIVDYKFLNQFKDLINYYYDEHLENQYEKFIEFKKHIFKFICNVYNIIF